MEKSRKAHYLDRVWFEQLKKIGSLELGLFAERKQSLTIDHANRKIILTSRKKLVVKNRKTAGRKVHSKLRRLRKLESNILKHEKNQLIKSTYLNQVKAVINFTKISRVKIDTNLSEQEKNLKIHHILARIYPQPDYQESRLFVNEFIYFLKYFQSNDLISSEFDIPITPAFYNVEKHDVEVDPEDLARSLSNFEKVIDSNPDKVYRAKEVKEIFKKILTKLNISNSAKIKILDRNVFSVNSASRSVIIPKDIQIRGKRLVQIISHEIVVHLYRAMKGKINITVEGSKLKLLQIGTPNYLATEEGLASFFEQNVFYASSKHDIMNLFNFYLRTIAVHLAINFEPYEVYEKLDLLCRIQASIQKRSQDFVDGTRDLLLIRTYRGFLSPQKGCANAKISQYLSGNRQIWNFIEQGGNINNLFAGKIALENLEEVKALGFNIPEEYLDSKDFPRDRLLEIIGGAM